MGEGGGDVGRWRRGLECLCDTQGEGETHGERKKKIESERGARVLVSPTNQFSWGICHQPQQRRRAEEEADSGLRRG